MRGLQERDLIDRIEEASDMRVDEIIYHVERLHLPFEASFRMRLALVIWDKSGNFGPSRPAHRRNANNDVGKSVLADLFGMTITAISLATTRFDEVDNPYDHDYRDQDSWHLDFYSAFLDRMLDARRRAQAAVEVAEDAETRMELARSFARENSLDPEERMELVQAWTEEVEP